MHAERYRVRQVTAEEAGAGGVKWTKAPNEAVVGTRTSGRSSALGVTPMPEGA